jgi:hypothetical protein
MSQYLRTRLHLTDEHLERCVWISAAELKSYFERLLKRNSSRVSPVINLVKQNYPLILSPKLVHIFEHFPSSINLTFKKFKACKTFRSCLCYVRQANPYKVVIRVHCKALLWLHGPIGPTWLGSDVYLMIEAKTVSKTSYVLIYFLKFKLTDKE